MNQNTNSCSSDCSSCNAGCNARDLRKNAHAASSIKRIIGVASGKSGVGKSLVTSLLSVLMKRKGFKVGILDADVTDPSIPKMFGIKEKAVVTELGIIPTLSKTGIEVISLNLLLPNETDPVVWRGPVIGSMVSQLYTDVIWRDIDFLFVDMPPGTSDIALTVLQQIRPNGVIMVSIPQDLVQLIVHKTIEMVNQMNIKMLGVVLNMSYYTCPCCGEDFVMYKKSLEEFSKYRILAELPAMTPLAELSCNEGTLNENIEELVKPIARVVIDEMKVINMPY